MMSLRSACPSATVMNVSAGVVSVVVVVIMVVDRQIVVDEPDGRRLTAMVPCQRHHPSR